MHLAQFIKSNKINLTNDIQDLCEKGIKRMEGSPDPLHDPIHVFEILDDLDKFLHEQDEIDIKELDFNVLLPAICWHDVWKAKLKQTENLFRMIYEQYRDGLGSMKIFLDETRNSSLPLETRKNIAYCIKVHTSFQIRKRKSQEAQLLVDMDNLQTWNEVRFKRTLVYYETHNALTIRKLKLVKFYFDKFMRKQTDKGYYFKWSKQEFIKRKAKGEPKMLKLHNDLIRKYSK